MVYTVTLNPSLDYVMCVDDIELGNVNRSQNEYILPGGKGINVSIVLSNLGIENTVFGFIAGFTGKEIKMMLEEQGCLVDFIAVEGNSRINVKIKSKDETDVNGNGPCIDDKSLEEKYKMINSRGTSNLGSGNVSFCLFAPHEYFDFDYYTAVYIIDERLANINVNSDEYKQEIKKDKEILNEFPLFVEIEVSLPDNKTITIPFKGIIDSIIIDHYKKIVYLNDLKTTSQNIEYMMDQVIDGESFNGAFGKGHYYRQFAIYTFLLQMYLDHVLLLGNYDIQCNIIAIETNNSYRAGIYKVNNAYIEEGIKEFKELICKIAYYELYGYDANFPES